MSDERSGRGPRARIAVTLLVALALAATGAPLHADDSVTITGRIVISELRVTLELSRTVAPVGTKLSAKAVVWNDGRTTARSILVTIRVDHLGVVVGRPVARTIKSIDPGASRAVTWSICGSQPGVYLILAQATLEAVTLESPARVLTITSRPGAKC